MGTLREVNDKNIMNTKIVEFHYSDKQRCEVFDIFVLVNQPFSYKRCVYCIFSPEHLYLLSLTAFYYYCNFFLLLQISFIFFYIYKFLGCDDGDF